MKINHKLLRTYLSGIVKTVFDNAFYLQATDTAEFPYAVYEYTARSAIDEGMGTLEFNVWDRGGGTERVEEIADALENGLNQKAWTDEYLVLKFYTNTRNSIADPDKKMRRIRLTFDMQFYFGREKDI